MQSPGGRLNGRAGLSLAPGGDVGVLLVLPCLDTPPCYGEAARGSNGECRERVFFAARGTPTPRLAAATFLKVVGVLRSLDRACAVGPPFGLPCTTLFGPRRLSVRIVD